MKQDYKLYFHNRIKISCLFLFISAYLMINTGYAYAHRVTIFAWVEGDTIHTESKFSDGKAVKGGDIIVSGLQGKQLLKGKTDDHGEFSFRIPEKTAMKLIVLAGMGHRGEWTIPLDEIQPSAGEPAEPADLQKKTVSGSEIKPEIEPALNLNPNNFQFALEKALDKKLSPVIRMLAELREPKGPAIHDILGGIGYIFGFVGIAAYFNYRRKKTDL